MKKIYSLALVAMIAISAIANVQPRMYDNKSMKRISDVPVKEQLTKSISERPMLDAAVYSNGQVPSVAKARKAYAEDATAQDTAYYLVSPYDAAYGGVYPDGNMSYPTIWQRANADVEFWNFSEFNEDGDFGWFIGDVDPDNMLSADTNMVVPAGFFKPGYGAAATPIFAMESGAQYAYGDCEEKQYWYAFDPEEYSALTRCHMFTSTAYSDDGGDYGCFSLSSDMKYLLGTGIDMTPYAALGYECGAVDTIGTMWGFENCTTKIDTISVMAMSKGSTSLAIGNKLTMTLLPIRKSGQYNLIDFKNPYASITATRNNITFEYSGSSETYGNVALGCISFPFKLDIEGEFFIIMSGFNGRGANIGLYSDGVDPCYAGDTYYISNNTNFYNYFGVNALISVNAAIVEPALPTALDKVAEQQVKVKKEIRNGQLVITRGEKSFNVLGAQL